MEHCGFVELRVREPPCNQTRLLAHKVVTQMINRRYPSLGLFIPGNQKPRMSTPYYAFCCPDVLTFFVLLSFIVAGTPTASLPAGISLVITDPAPVRAF